MQNCQNMEYVEDIIIQIEFDDSLSACLNSIQVVPANLEWKDFELMLKLSAGSNSVSIFYLDEEAETVIISSEDELKEAFKVAKKANNTLCLKIKPQRSTPPKAKKTNEIRTDVKNQSVSMTINDKQADGNQVVPIAVETGERMNMTEQSCDQLSATAKQSTKLYRALVESHIPRMKAKSTQNGAKRFFFIRIAPSDLVLDVAGWRDNPGTPVILYKKKDINKERVGNQLWYEDEKSGTIRSKFCNLCLTTLDTGPPGYRHLVVLPYDKHAINTAWKIEDNELVDLNGQLFQPWEMAIGAPVWMSMGKQSASLTALLGEFRHKTSRDVKLNKETGEAQSSVKPKAERRKVDAYARLAASCKRQPSLTDCMPSNKKQAEDRKPPGWFKDYMENFKKDMIESCSSKISNRTVNKVLRGLEGAVITSVKEVNNHVTEANDMSADRAKKPAGKTMVSQSQEDLYCHSGVSCDHCDQTILGIRYKCGNCSDYDLCGRCESLKDVHDEDHVFLKIRRPVYTAGRERDGRVTPLLRRNLYKHEVELYKMIHADNHHQDFPQPDHHPEVTSSHGVRHSSAAKDSVDKLKRKQEKLRRKGEKIRVKEDKLKRRIDEEKELPQKKEKLNLPQYQVPDHMDASFVRDDNLPDGTCVPPGERFIKRWLLKNTGTSPWGKGTVIEVIYGNMNPVQAKYDVPNVLPGEDGLIVVEMDAPEEEGVFQSHWRLSYCGVQFGHRVWCSIVVIPTPKADESTHASANNGIHPAAAVTDEMTQASSSISTDKQAVESESHQAEVAELTIVPSLAAAAASPQALQGALSKEDLLSFEMLDIAERNDDVSKVSQTATPNNTPLESRNVSPPASPTGRLSPVLQLVDDDVAQVSQVPLIEEADDVRRVSESSGSIVVVVSSGSDGVDATADHDDSVQDESVDRQMMNLVLDDDVDLESLSSCYSSDSSEALEDDFFIIPVPDFFDPQRPASRSASTKHYINRETHLETKVEEVEHLEADNTDEVFELAVETAINEVTHQFESETESDGNQSDDNNEELGDADEAEHVTTETESLVTQEVKQVNVPAPKDESEAAASTAAAAVQGDGDEDDDDDVKGAAAAVNSALEEEEVVLVYDRQRVEILNPLDHNRTPQRPKHVASTIVTHALDIATKAGTQVFHTAKDVFHTLQARNSYEAPKSTWSPPEPNWQPNDDAWTPPAPADVAQPVEQHTPTTPSNREAMESLIEMGFANRVLNQRLLERHEDNVAKAVADLIQMGDDNWCENRH